MSQYIFNLTDPLKPTFSVSAYTTNGYISPTSTTLDLRAISANTSLLLYGAGTPEYGKVIQANMIHIMENFASPIEPQESLEGQLWYNNSTNIMLVRNNTPNDGIPANFTNRWASLQSSGTGGSLDMGGNSIINVALPVNPTDATNMQYVDSEFDNVNGALILHTLDTSIHITSAQNVLLDGLVSTLAALELNALDDIRLIDGSVQVQLDDRLSKSGNPDTNNVMGSGVNVTFSGGEVLGLPAIPTSTAAASKEYINSVAIRTQALSAFSNINVAHKVFPAALGTISPAVTSIAYNSNNGVAIASVDSGGTVSDEIQIRRQSDNNFNTWVADSTPPSNAGISCVTAEVFGSSFSFWASGRGGQIWVAPNPLPAGPIGWNTVTPSAGGIGTTETIVDIQSSKTQALIIAISSPTYVYVAINTGPPVWSQMMTTTELLKSNLDGILFNVAIVATPASGVVVYQSDKLTNQGIFTPSTPMVSTFFIPQDITFNSLDGKYYICGVNSSSQTGEIWTLTDDLLTWDLVYSSPYANTTILNIIVTPHSISAIVHHTLTNEAAIVSYFNDGDNWHESRRGIQNTPAIPPVDERFGLVDVGLSGSIDFDVVRGTLMFGGIGHQYQLLSDAGIVLETLAI